MSECVCGRNSRLRRSRGRRSRGMSVDGGCGGGGAHRHRRPCQSRSRIVRSVFEEIRANGGLANRLRLFHSPLDCQARRRVADLRSILGG